MFAQESLAKLVCRPALPKDTAEVLEFTRRIWEGQDYIPHVWADWLSDPSGLLAVAELGGLVVGLGKLTALSTDQWWLEGLRVHPDFEGQGIASRLHDYLLDVWERTGTGIIRFVTASFRKPIHHIAERTGFNRAGELTFYSARTLPPGGPANFSYVDSSEIQRANELIKDSDTSRLAKGFIDLGWQWASFEPAFLIQAIECRQAFWWRDGSGLIIERDEREDEVNTSLIQLLACRENEAAACLSEFKQFGSERGNPRVGWYVLTNPILVEILESAGYQREWDSSLYLFEKK